MKKTVGEGTYGVVLQCVDKAQNRGVAVKRFKKNSSNRYVRRTMARELLAQQLLRGEPNVVQLLEAFKYKGALHLVMELFEENLLDLLDRHPKGLPPEVVRRLIYTLLLGVRSCHRRGVLHRDIKPENVLLQSSSTDAENTGRSSSGDLSSISATLCDFGFSKLQHGKSKHGLPFYKISQLAHDCWSDSVILDMEEEEKKLDALDATSMTDYVATRWYRSPEMLLGFSHYGYPVDLWAVGAIMAEVCDGQPLLPGKTEAEQIQLIEERIGVLPKSYKALLERRMREFPAWRNENNVQTSNISESQCTHTEKFDSHFLEKRFDHIIGAEGVHLLRQLLKIDAKERINVHDALRHPFFAGLREGFDQGVGSEDLWRWKSEERPEEKPAESQSNIISKSVPDLREMHSVGQSPLASLEKHKNFIKAHNALMELSISTHEETSSPEKYSRSYCSSSSSSRSSIIGGLTSPTDSRAKFSASRGVPADTTHQLGVVDAEDSLSHKYDGRMDAIAQDCGYSGRFCKWTISDARTLTPQPEKELCNGSGESHDKLAAEPQEIRRIGTPQRTSGALLKAPSHKGDTEDASHSSRIYGHVLRFIHRIGSDAHRLQHSSSMKWRPVGDSEKSKGGGTSEGHKMPTLMFRSNRSSSPSIPSLNEPSLPSELEASYPAGSTAHDVLGMPSSRPTPTLRRPGRSKDSLHRFSGGNSPSTAVQERLSFFKENATPMPSFDNSTIVPPSGRPAALSVSNAPYPVGPDLLQSVSISTCHLGGSEVEIQGVGKERSISCISIESPEGGGMKPSPVGEAGSAASGSLATPPQTAKGKAHHDLQKNLSDVNFNPVARSGLSKAGRPVRDGFDGANNISLVSMESAQSFHEPKKKSRLVLRD